MVQKLMAELKVLIGKRAPMGGPPPGPPPAQHQYTRRDLKTNLSRHMSIVLDRFSAHKFQLYLRFAKHIAACGWSMVSTPLIKLSRVMLLGVMNAGLDWVQRNVGALSGRASPRNRHGPTPQEPHDAPALPYYPPQTSICSSAFGLRPPAGVLSGVEGSRLRRAARAWPPRSPAAAHELRFEPPRTPGTIVAQYPRRGRLGRTRTFMEDGRCATCEALGRRSLTSKLLQVATAQAHIRTCSHGPSPPEQMVHGSDLAARALAAKRRKSIAGFKLNLPQDTAPRSPAANTPRSTFARRNTWCS
ncbi:unnamed protein product, partial [Iphiclides podalirius]